MTAIKLAEEFEAGRDLHTNADEFRVLIAAALRLADEVHESCAELTMGGPRYHKFHGKRSPSVNIALDEFRSAAEAAGKEEAHG